MSLLKNIVAFLKNTKEENQSTASPEGMCPNCWGREEYGGQFYQAVKHNKTDVNSSNPNVGWIQDYADKHLTDIQLQPSEGNHACPKCKQTYKVTYVPT